MVWNNKFDDLKQSHFIKLEAEQNITIDLQVEPIKRVNGDGKTYYDIKVRGTDKLLSCTSYLFETILKELDKLDKAKAHSYATLCIKKIKGERTSWVVVLINTE